MKHEVLPKKKTLRATQAMTLVEVCIAVVAVGILITTLYVAFTQGFAIIQVARENLRATQILQEKMETLVNGSSIRSRNPMVTLMTGVMMTLTAKANSPMHFICSRLPQNSK